MYQPTEPLDPVQRAYRNKYWRTRAILLIVLLAIGAFIYWWIFAEVPVDYANDSEHFKYGSIGSDTLGGVPYWIWRVLPEMFPEHLPDPQRFLKIPEDDRTPLDAYAKFGFVVEKGMDRPIGFSKRRDLVDRVGLNCSVCHHGALRVSEGMDPKKIYGREPNYATDEQERIIILGMPGHTVQLMAYFEFLFKCAGDGRFTATNVLSHIESKTDLGPIDSFFYRQAVPQVRQTLLQEQQLVTYFTENPADGPGRIDTFNPYKAIQFGFPFDGTIGTADFPSIWNQRPRETMHLHWDGNNTSVFERNISASFGAGATPVSLDMPRMLRVADWIGSPDPRQPVSKDEIQKARRNPVPRKGELPIPQYPFPIDEKLAAGGKKLYEQHCAACHDFSGEHVGKVEPIEEIGTDPHRLDSYTIELAVNQGTLGAGHWWRFQKFRKTGGYANMPLDGIWARAPYLHNGSVPTLRDLMNAPGERPETFYRGDEVYDPVNVGFRSDREKTEEGRKLFLFDTKMDGNNNSGHAYGTHLSNEEKDAVVEYMKRL